MASLIERSVTQEIAMPGNEGVDFDAKNDPRGMAGEDTLKRFEYYADSLKNHFEDAEKWWKMYLLIRKQSFKPWEYWRNKITTAHPNTVIEVSTAHLVSQVFSHSPPIAPESTMAIGSEALEARMTKWFAYQLRMNKFRRELELFVREMLVQSIAVRKNALIERSREIIFFPGEALAEEFDEKLRTVVMEMGAKPPQPEEFEDKQSFMQAFEEFRKAVNGASDIGLPEMPVAGPRKITQFKGAGWKRISMFNFFYDPAVSHDEAEDYILASSADEKWVRKNAMGESSPFDPDMVERALANGTKERGDMFNAQTGGNQFEERLARALSSSSVDSGREHPGKKKPIILLEHYYPASKVPYRVVLNGLCINRRKTNPFNHGDFPFTIATNANVPFISSGISELMPGESLFRETNNLRSLTSDGVLLSVLPIFSRIRESGLTDLAKFVVPGAILDSARGSRAIEQVSKVTPPDTLRHLAELRTEIEDATGTYPQARGAIGPTSVTATQTERSFQGLAVRNQLKLHRLESDLSTLPPQWLSIAYQFLDDKDISSLNKLLVKELTSQYSLEDFSQAIGMDWAFRASNIVANKELQISNLKDLLTIGVNAFAAQPTKPVSFDRLYLAIVEKTDPDLAELIKTTPEEAQQQQLEAQAAAEAGAGPEASV